MIEVRRAKLALRGVYACCVCGRNQVGDTYTVEVDRLRTYHLMNLAQDRPPAVHMPVGWASYTEGFKCPECKT